MKVEVYWNFHKKCYSVRKPNGKILFHTHDLSLENVTFNVQESGRQRVLRTKRKNVHAYVRGTVVENKKINGDSITYNPYKYSSFVSRKNQKPIFSAKFAQLLVKDQKECILIR